MTFCLNWMDLSYGLHRKADGHGKAGFAGDRILNRRKVQGKGNRQAFCK